jgi:hypothetical protein
MMHGQKNKKKNIKLHIVHVYTLVILPTFKILAWQVFTAVYTVLRLLMMGNKSVRDM